MRTAAEIEGIIGITAGRSSEAADWRAENGSISQPRYASESGTESVALRNQSLRLAVWEQVASRWRMRAPWRSAGVGQNRYLHAR
jgi:hypothetical protein